MKLVEEYEGIGAVAWRDETFGSVPYRLRRFQGMARSGLPVPGVHRIEGEIDLKAIPDPSRLVDCDLTLRLEDGRSMRIALADRQGRVLTEGHGPSRCSCC
ncbi:MAG TPA: hypothetical protein VIM81_19465 [Gammaproteobacteria bacterium]